MLRMTREEFEQVVQQAIAEIPDDFSKKIENVEVRVEDYPSKEVQRSMRVSPNGLLGLYTGVPHNKRSGTYPPIFPDRIHIYQRNLEAFARNREELIEQIQRTVLHEIGHYFGINDHRLRELGF